MPVVRNPDKEYSYVLACDRELSKEEQTVFYYKPAGLEAQYNALDSNLILEKVKGGETIAKMNINKEGEVDLLLTCITKIDNLKDEGGNVLDWNKGNDASDSAKYRKKILSVLRGEWRAELAEVIRTGSGLDEEDLKN
jgi:hypothetical protein